MKSNKKTLFTLFWQFSLLGLAGCALVLSAFFLYLSPSLPSVDSIRDVRLQTPLRVYSSDGKLIGEFGEMRRKPIKLRDVPQAFIDALLAGEDADFYSHKGVSLKGLARAAKELATTGKKGSGGSTLTMQLTRHVFFSLEKKFSRKFNEIILAMKLERELTKDEILELYINYMFLGNRAYGAQAAAEVYYGKNLAELSVAQLATLAGSFQLPSRKNAIVNPEWTKERRDWILGRMLELEKIDTPTYRQALAEPINASYHGSQFDAHAPYVAEMARAKAIQDFGLSAYTDGYRVYTSVDSHLQITAQKAIVDGLMAYDLRHGYRGPEQKLDIAQVVPLDADNELFDYGAWQEQIESIPSYGGLEPAVVTAVSDTELTLLLKKGETTTLYWDQKLDEIRVYVNENSKNQVESLPKLFSIGDVIRVKPKSDGSFEFAQVPEVQGALVSLNPKNGAILALAGGFDFEQSHFNRAIQAYRQPGSNFKPFIYTAALESGMTPATIINDAPIVIEDAQLEDTWRPENDSKKFYGPTRLRKALYLSRNVVSIKLLREMGINNTVESLTRFGFDPEKLPKNLSLALGTLSLTPLELATAWATFANGGYKIDAYLVDKVLDADGNVVFQASPVTVCKECELQASSNASPALESKDSMPVQTQEAPDFSDDIYEMPFDVKSQLGMLEAADFPRAQRVISEDVMFILDSMLKDVIKRGTGVRAKVLNRGDIAGKTGTTNGPTDVWFSGYTPQIVTSTWIGFDQQQALGNTEYGGTAALPIWIDFMREALQNKPEEYLPQPPSVVTLRINPETGKRARIDDPDAIFEYFLRDNLPEETEEEGENSNPHDVFSDEIF